MTQISFQDDATGEFIKQWPNWTGVVPAVGDMVVLPLVITMKRNAVTR